MMIQGIVVEMEKRWVINIPAKKYIPNILTTARIGSSLCLVFAETSSFMFMFFYIMAGFTDMLDGFLARKLNAATSFGEKYDSFADIVLIGVCSFKILPILHLRIWEILWISLIALIKAVNLAISYRLHRNKLFLHTIANKVMGLMLFITPIVLMWIPLDYILVILCLTATFAAVQEGYLLKTGIEEP